MDLDKSHNNAQQKPMQKHGVLMYTQNRKRHSSTALKRGLKGAKGTSNWAGMPQILTLVQPDVFLIVYAQDRSISCVYIVPE